MVFEEGFGDLIVRMQSRHSTSNGKAMSQRSTPEGRVVGNSTTAAGHISRNRQSPAGLPTDGTATECDRAKTHPAGSDGSDGQQNAVGSVADRDPASSSLLGRRC